MQERFAEAAPVANPPLDKPVFPRSADYMRLLSFVVSNARKGEIMAIENYGEMVHMMPDTDSKIETVHQAKEECKHILLLEKLAKTIGFPIQDTMVEPQWINVRGHFHEAARKKDLAACLIIQDLMVESLAIGLYKVFASAANGDTETQTVAANLLQDELDHLEIGIKRIRALIEKDSDAVHDALVWAHHKVMPNLFEMVHQACNFLCDQHSLDCDTVDKGTTYIDLELLKITSLEHYVDMLYRAEFDTKITNQLMASMISYEVPGRKSIGLDCLKILAAR
jgi:fatty aldehyde decarbonylase